MATKLTKGALQGKQFTDTVTVDVFGEKFDVDIRPLSGPEAEQVESLMQAGTDLKGRGSQGRMEQSMSIDMAKNSKGRKDSDIKACAYGTVDEEFTEASIKEDWPNVLITQVAEKVKTLSGIGNADDVDSFPGGGEEESEQQ